MSSSYTFYDAIVPMAQASLNTLSHLLTQASTHPDASLLLTARLAPDMHPLPYQIHYASYSAHVITAYLTSAPLPSEPPQEPEPTYSHLHTLVAKAIEALGTIEVETANRLSKELTAVERSSRKALQVHISAVVERRCMANIYFHVGMAYAILRKEGVEVGKRDWLNGFVREFV